MKRKEALKMLRDDVQRFIYPYQLHVNELGKDTIEEILKMMAHFNYVDELLTNLQIEKHCDCKDKIKPKKTVRKKSSARSTKQKSR